MVGLYILDVSGHGVASALMSVTLSRLLSPPSEPSSILIRSADATGRCDVTPPAEVADRLNRLFPFGSATDKFATMVYGILNAATGEFRYVAAGRAGPVHVPSGADPVTLKGQGISIGMADDAYEEQSILLGPGDRLYLCSDGVTEAMDSSGKQFGDARLLESIARDRSEPPHESVAPLLGEIARWRGFERFQDDISILAVEVPVATGPGEPGVASPATSVSPNPLNPEATLTFTTSKPGNVKVEMFDVKGSLVRTIIGPTHMAAGSHNAKIDGRGLSGGKLAPGIYIVRGATGDGTSRTRSRS